MHEALYSYGEVLLFIHLEERGIRGLVTNIWKDAEEGLSALGAIQAYVGEEDFPTLWMDHNTGSVVLDYPDGAFYSEYLSQDRFTTSITGAGIEFVEAPRDRAIQDYGFHIHKLSSPTKDKYRIQVWVNPIGSMNSIGAFRGRIVHFRYGEAEVIPLDLESYFDERMLEVEAFDELYLIVGAYSDELRSEFDEGEVFRYSYSIEGMDPPREYVPPEEEEFEREIENITLQELVCGCNYGNSRTLGVSMMFFLLYGLRRRQKE